MSIDTYHFVKNGEIKQITQFPEEYPSEHSILQLRGGMLSLYFYENKAEAISDFEKWRREPCEDIQLTIDGEPQLGSRGSNKGL